jgi:heme-degrading monooxygenase HmoA
MSDKTYINGLFIKVKETKFGEVVSVSINVKTLIEELKKHTNAKGYVNIDLLRRKEADKQGNTHYAVLNEWQPKSDYKAPATSATTDDNHDLPF